MLILILLKRYVQSAVLVPLDMNLLGDRVFKGEIEVNKLGPNSKWPVVEEENRPRKRHVRKEHWVTMERQD